MGRGDSGGVLVYLAGKDRRLSDDKEKDLIVFGLMIF